MGEVGKPADRLGFEAVTLVAAFDNALDDAGLLEHLEVLGDRGLGEGEEIDEVTGRAGFALGEFADDAYAGGVAQGAEDGGGALFFFGEPLNFLHDGHCQRCGVDETTIGFLRFKHIVKIR